MPFPAEEVAEVVSSLKLSKAAGPDDIDPEHLRYGGETLITTLVTLFNTIVSSGHIPAAFRCGLVIPIPKGHSKDLANPSNCRGITILSNISKILEKLVLRSISELDPHPLLTLYRVVSEQVIAVLILLLCCKRLSRPYVMTVRRSMLRSLMLKRHSILSGMLGY